MTAISRAHRVAKGTVDLKGLSLWDVGLNAALALQPLTLGKSLPLSGLRVKARPMAVRRTSGLAAVGQRSLPLTADLGKALALSL